MKSILYESKNINSASHLEQSKEECEHLINLAKPHMVKSSVVDSKTGRSTESRFAFVLCFRKGSNNRRLYFCSCICSWETSSNARFYTFPACRVRTSSGMFLKRGRDKIIRNIEKRIADFAFIPVGMSLPVVPVSSCLSLSFLSSVFWLLALIYKLDMFDSPWKAS